MLCSLCAIEFSVSLVAAANAMADDWKQCAEWLVRCGILAPEHPAARPTGQLQNLAAVLRDGVLICMLLNRLYLGAINLRDYSPHPQVSLVICTFAS